MEWKSEYETGVAEIDHQHQTIVQLVTEFEAAVKAKRHWSSLHSLITGAKDYARFHFAVEESLMQIFSYPELPAHRSEHRFVLERIADFEARVLKGEMRDYLIPGLRTWLLGHFLDGDRQFMEFMRKLAPAVKMASVPAAEDPVQLDTDALEQAMRRALCLAE